jgi:FKBP-type peptidyl-prolyl cis-trans isomerase FklB
MKAIWGGFLAVLLLVTPVLAADSGALKSQKDKISYTLGADIGRTMKHLEVEVDPEIFAKGFREAVSGGKLMLTEEEMQTILAAFKNDITAKQMEKMKKVAEKNKKEGEVFLTENKKKTGVKTLKSGLQYKVLKEGTGKIPKKTDKVVCQYQGTLIDGTEFDSSYKRGQPATFPVSGVIPGWTEALQMMKVGSKWQLFLPANLAYGERGAGSVIGPNSVLIFTVELMSIGK